MLLCWWEYLNPLWTVCHLLYIPDEANYQGARDSCLYVCTQPCGFLHSHKFGFRFLVHLKSQLIYSINMGIKERGHMCLHPFSVVGILSVEVCADLIQCWEIPKLSVSINQLQCTVGWRTGNIKMSQQVCVCLCVSVRILSMFHDLNTYCVTWWRLAHPHMHFPTCFKSQLTYPFFVGRKQRCAAFGGPYFSHQCENYCETC